MSFGTYDVRSRESEQSARRITVEFPDESQHEFHVPKHITGEQLLQRVTRHANVAEPSFYGLLHNNGTRKWLQREKRVPKNAHRLEFRVKFFTTEPNLIDARDRHQMFLQLKREFPEHVQGETEVHALMQASRAWDGYGVERHAARDVSGRCITLGIGACGLSVWNAPNECVNRFLWSKIISVAFRRRKFSVTLRRENFESRDTRIIFQLASYAACKQLWKSCVEHHTFFRLSSVESQKLRRLLWCFRIGSKFKYSGKTHAQIIASVNRNESNRRLTIAADTDGRFGFNIDARGRVSRVVPQSSAARDLRVGDCVVRINGRACSELSHREIVTLIRSSSTLSMHVQTGTVDTCSAAAEPDIAFTPDSPLTSSMRALCDRLSNGSEMAAFTAAQRFRDGETVSVSSAHAHLNRYRDVEPYDRTRVVLQHVPYVNASHVHMETRDWIASQGPMHETIDDFWTMIDEMGVEMIVMVTPLVENGRSKCSQYWPKSVGETIRFGRCTSTVELLHERCTDTFNERRLQLNPASRVIRQLEYAQWNDHSAPENLADFVKLIETVNAFRGTILVHCSAGIGRSGVVILVDTALSFMCMRKPIVPMELLHVMRDHRPHMIQTPDQYRFACETIVDLWKRM